MILLGGKLWTHSYFFETIDNANEETTRKYVQNQLIGLDRKERQTVGSVLKIGRLRPILLSQAPILLNAIDMSFSAK